MLGAESDIFGVLGAVAGVAAQPDDVLAQHLAAVNAAGRRRVLVMHLAQPEPPLAAPSLYAHGGDRRRDAATVRALPEVPEHADEATPHAGGRPGGSLQPADVFRSRSTAGMDFSASRALIGGFGVRCLASRCNTRSMLLRRDGGGVIAIGQPAHAWLSGQLARLWGNQRFGAVEPWEEVCLAAEQHDIGMAAWERRPTLNPRTGMPRSFMELELAEHLEIWWSAAPLVLPQSRYAALLVSMHGSSLYERRDLARLDPVEVERVGAFLAGQRELQGHLLAGLRADPRTAPAAAEELVRRNRRLVWTWDSLSLGLLLDWTPFELAAVPVAGGEVDIAVRIGRGGAITLDPWPFSAPRLTVRCEGRRLAGRFDDEETMRDALAAAPWVTVELELAAS
jgi:hypothetical protein